MQRQIVRAGVKPAEGEGAGGDGGEEPEPAGGAAVAGDDGLGAGGGVFLLLEEGVEIGAEARGGLGRGQMVEGCEGLREGGVLALAVGAGGEVGADLGGAGLGEAVVEQVGEIFLGAGAIHGGKMIQGFQARPSRWRER